MKFILLLFFSAVVSCSTAFNLTQFLNSHGVNVPRMIETSNCVPNGNLCTTSGTACCLSSVFVCQPNPSGVNTCSVSPSQRKHIPVIRQIVAAFGATTHNPIY